MSRAKKTKRQKEYSKLHSYRHLGDVINHAKNVAAGKPPRQRKQDFLEVINAPKDTNSLNT